MPANPTLEVSSGASSPITNVRWSRGEESSAFFLDEDRLRIIFYLLIAGSAFGLVALFAGLWRLNRAAAQPPAIVGIAHGLVFTVAPRGLNSVTDADFDKQLRDTVEVLFSRTEKGLPPEIYEFCSDKAVNAVEQAYRETAAKYPEGYLQTMRVLQTRDVASRAGFRHVRYEGLLSSRSASAVQTSAIYLDCIFIIQAPSSHNTVGWRLIKVDAISRDDFFREDRERQIRAQLGLPTAAPAAPAH
jgi:hypothetical protein